MYINQSLSYLEQCVVALSRRNAGHIPYRQSKLTNVLKVRWTASQLHQPAIRTGSPCWGEGRGVGGA